MTSESISLHPTEGRIWVPESSKKTKSNLTPKEIIQALLPALGVMLVLGFTLGPVGVFIFTHVDAADDSVAISNPWVAEEATELTGVTDWKVDSIYHQDDETAVAFLVTPTDSMLLNLKLVDDEWTVAYKPEVVAPIE